MKKVFLCLMFATTLVSCAINTPSKGQKIGRIVKLADEGMFYKTTEGELIRGGLVDGSGSMGTSFRFTIEDRKLTEIANEAFESQQEVILFYECEFISSITRSESLEPHFVKDIKIVR